MRILTGIRPSGDIHLGNYLGSIEPALKRQSDNECFFFLADLHTLTTLQDPLLLREYTLDITATWIACGLDISKHLLYRQSDIPFVTELSWYLSTVFGMGHLQKSHAYKDALNRGLEVNHAVFSYPVLMAADILLYDADIVPVGKDQKQHVEMARDMAGAFNAIYGEILTLPEVFIEESVMTIPGLDGRKMSKSYGNVLPLFAGEKGLKTLFLSIPTDSSALEEKKSMRDTTLGALFQALSDTENLNAYEEKLLAGGFGWGHAKLALLEIFLKRFKDIRTTYFALRKDEGYLRSVLQQGGEKAYAIGRAKINSVRERLGFLSL
jgi:tryptophanyl-tRNA synthetase